MYSTKPTAPAAAKAAPSSSHFDLDANGLTQIVLSWTPEKIVGALPTSSSLIPTHYDSLVKGSKGLLPLIWELRAFLRGAIEGSMETGVKFMLVKISEPASSMAHPGSLQNLTLTHKILYRAVPIKCGDALRLVSVDDSTQILAIAEHNDDPKKINVKIIPGHFSGFEFRKNSVWQVYLLGSLEPFMSACSTMSSSPAIPSRGAIDVYHLPDAAKASSGPVTALFPAPTFLPSYAFIHVEGTEKEGEDGRSCINEAEAGWVADLVGGYQAMRDIDVAKRVVVLAFHRGQAALLQGMLQPTYPGIRVATVASFIDKGGLEKDHRGSIVIISLARTEAKKKKAEFTALNQVLSRLVHAVVIMLGHVGALVKQGPDAQALIQDTMEGSCFFDAEELSKALVCLAKPAISSLPALPAIKADVGKKEKPVCHFYGTKAGCTNGTACTFAHVLGVMPSGTKPTVAGAAGYASRDIY